MKSTEVYKTIKEWAEYFKNIIKRIVGILEQKAMNDSLNKTTIADLSKDI